MNVLVIEDDNRIANLVERALTEDGHHVTVSHNGREGAELLLAGQFDAALLDILLPEMDGFEVLEQVRAKRCKTPILVLTAVDAVPKILHAFDLGADDYLVKPFILEIVLARVGAIARRVATTELPAASAGGVTLDRNRRVAIRLGKEIALTR
jgi:two-component system OmpR family response regulator